MRRIRRSDPDCNEYSASERGAIVAQWMREGADLSTVEIARRLGITRDGALRLMRRLQRRALPDVEQVRGRWQRVGF